MGHFFSNMPITLKGIRTNNLKNIDVVFPQGKLTVVTGVSGSGKSSLVFDTLYGESYRRYVDSLSSFARQYLKTLPRPEVDFVENLPSSIAVQQTRSGAGNRSTVGTLTEINDLLRLIFAYGSVPHCPNGHGPIKKENPSTVADNLFENLLNEKVIVTAPLSHLKNIKAKLLVSQIMEQGFVRVLYRNEVVRIDELDMKEIHESQVIIDRLKLDSGSRARLIDAVKTAFKLGSGELYVKHSQEILRFSKRMECYDCGVKVKAPTLALFNWNHPSGACNTCQGYGMEAVIDWEKVFPDKDLSLNQKCIKALNFGTHTRYYNEIKKNAQGVVDLDKPLKSYTKADWEWLKYGEKSPRKGKRKTFEAVTGYFKWLDTKKYKAHYRMHAARFRKYVVCGTCNGNRLNSDALGCEIVNHNIGEVSSLTIEQLENWLESVKETLLNDQSYIADSSTGVLDALEEAKVRVGYVNKMGLSYLSLSRSSKTLSGGELQRVNMARCLGSALTQTMFCLDEPTAGLHARDSEKLLSVLKELRDLGNTVVVVEHDPIIIKGADHVIEIGPEAGHNGGHLVFSGSPIDVKHEHIDELNLTTDRKLKNKKSEFITLFGASTHNLKNVDLKIPLGSVTGVCGVSGSGKTSLIQHTLYPALCKVLEQSKKYETSDARFDKIEPKNLSRCIADVDIVSQGSLGRSTRSTIATYLGLMNGIRAAFAKQQKAIDLGLGPGHFSFNVPGGRCETCKGLGTVVEDLSFLGDMAVTCPDCNGQRFGNDVLDVNYKGKNLNEVLKMTVAEARVFFHGERKVTEILDHVISLGLSYINLGQNTSSFSGGEAQRLKLLNLLKDAQKKFSQKPSVLIFDEPTTGLSEKDVGLLISQFRKLSELGHTVIIIEHHIGLLKAVDHLIEVGPESAHNGGEIIFQGAPATLLSKPHAVTASSSTAVYLRH